LAILIAGCSTGGPKTYTEPKIDETLPTPQNVKVLSGITSVAFEWDKIDDTAVEGFVIYRSEDEGKLFKVAKTDSRFSTHYVDSGLKPDQGYSYRLTTYNAKDFESEPSKMVTVKTQDIPEAISYIDKVENLPRMAKLIFRPHTDPSIVGYKIERQTPQKKEWKEIASLEGRLNAEFIDTGLEDDKVYEYRIFAARFDGIKSYPSNTVSTVTKKLPPRILDAEASKNIPKKIKVVWLAPKNANALTYNIYTSDFHDGPFQKKTTVDATEYVDILENDGKVVYYKITATDKDGLESKMPEISLQGSTKAKPLTPTIIKADIVNSVPVIEWSSRDVNVVEFKVTRKKILGYFSKESVDFTGIKERKFTDTNEGFVPNVEFQYSITAIDNDGIESVPSEKVSLTHIVKEKEQTK